MITNISSKNITPSDALKDMINKKIRKLDKYFNADTQADIVLSVERSRHIIEVTIPNEGVLLRAQEVTDDMYTSIDNVMEKLEKQITRHRTRLEKRHRGTPSKFSAAGLDAPGADPHEPRIVRTKRFAIKPLDPEEAALQMQLLDHDFFVFLNAHTEEVNVIYRRHDGDLGLIEPSYDD